MYKLLNRPYNEMFNFISKIFNFKIFNLIWNKITFTFFLITYAGLIYYDLKKEQEKNEELMNQVAEPICDIKPLQEKSIKLIESISEGLNIHLNRDPLPEISPLHDLKILDKPLEAVLNQLSQTQIVLTEEHKTLMSVKVTKAMKNYGESVKTWLNTFVLDVESAILNKTIEITGEKISLVTEHFLTMLKVYENGICLANFYDINLLVTLSAILYEKNHNASNLDSKMNTIDNLYKFTINEFNAKISPDHKEKFAINETLVNKLLIDFNMEKDEINAMSSFKKVEDMSNFSSNVPKVIKALNNF